MAYERRRHLSSESEHSSSSTSYSTESTKNSRQTSSYSTSNIKLETYSKIVPNRSNPIKRNPTMSSPAELLLARTKNSFVDLNPFFQCSSLPSHWRKNKSLHFVVRTKHPMTIKTNTRVVLFAGNDYNPSPSLKNHISWFRDGQAEFNDLRFLGASGRGKKFTLTMVIESDPPQQCTYRRAIKITVDGPRKKRDLKSKSDLNVGHGEDSNSDGESDNESRTTNCSSMTIEMKPSINPSSGLDLLAAVAEQKRLDEQAQSSGQRHSHRPSIPMDINYSLNCLSPTSSLVSQFSQSIGFSPHSILSSDEFSSNVLLSFASTPSRLTYYHPPSRHDQQTIVETTSSSSNSSPNTHVLCR